MSRRTRNRRTILRVRHRSLDTRGAIRADGEPAGPGVPLADGLTGAKRNRRTRPGAGGGDSPAIRRTRAPLGSGRTACSQARGDDAAALRRGPRPRHIAQCRTSMAWPGAVRSWRAHVPAPSVSWPAPAVWKRRPTCAERSAGSGARLGAGRRGASGRGPSEPTTQVVRNACPHDRRFSYGNRKPIAGLGLPGGRNENRSTLRRCSGVDPMPGTQPTDR